MPGPRAAFAQHRAGDARTERAMRRAEHAVDAALRDAECFGIPGVTAPCVMTLVAHDVECLSREDARRRAPRAARGRSAVDPATRCPPAVTAASGGAPVGLAWCATRRLQREVPASTVQCCY